MMPVTTQKVPVPVYECKIDGFAGDEPEVVSHLLTKHTECYLVDDARVAAFIARLSKSG